MPLVIIADDDTLVVDIVRAALESRGHVVCGLPDGKSVPGVVELKRPDVVILDCAMDDVSGIAALKAIRSSEVTFDTPVLMLTARRSRADEEIAISAGADDYLRKPFHPDELVARVEALIEKAAVNEERKRRSEMPAAVSGGRPSINAHAPIDREIFDPEMLARVEKLMASDRLHAYLEALDAQFLQILRSSGDDAHLGSHAHKIVNQAGMLGLTRMCAAAAALDDACRSNAGQAEALSQCRAAAGDVRRYAIPAMQAVATTGKARGLNPRARTA